MKRYFIVLMLAMVSCNGSKDDWRVTSKFPKATDGWGNRNIILPPCLCAFTYSRNGWTQAFQDSCNKYNVGDTLRQ